MRATLALLLGTTLSALAEPLPIYFEDDHAGSFFHLAETLDLDEPHVLLLIDEHSDASAVRESDAVRDGLRRVRSAGERKERLDAWRRDGKVQAFSWIEPLMPMPFESVWWLAPDGGDDIAEIAAARQQLDGRLATDTRRSGSLAERFHRVGFEGFSEALPEGVPVVVTIDLDYFAKAEPSAVAARFEAIWSRVLALPHLRAITFSVSRPWLADDVMAHSLLERGLRAALSLRNAEVRFEPFVPRGPDRSERAKEFFALGEPPPRYAIDTAPASLRGLLLSHADRVSVRVQPERWQALLDQWRADGGDWRVVVDDRQPSTDEIWRLREPAALRVLSSPRRPVPRQVRWFALRPESMVNNVLPEMPSGKLFATAATPFVRDVETELATTEDGALAAEGWSGLLDAKTRFGSVRIVAEVRETEDGEWQRTPETEIRIVKGEGFRAALSEQFGMPYVFGAGFLAGGGETGPETRAGNDCANFLVYAWRRCGKRIGWCDPLRLRRHLKLLGDGLEVDSDPPITAEAIGRGLVVHCGKHVAAVWEDRAPIGVLDADDLVAHHLSGPPELITLRELLSDRPQPTYDLMAMAPVGDRFDLVAGGDICLSGDPSPQFPIAVRNADLAIANLECALTSRQEPARKKRYMFRADPDAAELLTEFNALSLANNHTGDFGAAGQSDTAAALDAAGIASFGLNPWRFKAKRCGELAFFGINYVENEKADADSALLQSRIAQAKSEGATVIVLPHWGREHTSVTTAEQRRRARWLIEIGADLILGAGPHCRQPLDYYRGRPIFYSLGNAYFPPRGPVPPQFHQAFWARIGIDAKGDLEAGWR